MEWPRNAYVVDQREPASLVDSLAAGAFNDGAKWLSKLLLDECENVNFCCN